MTSTRAWLELRLSEFLRSEYGLDLARGRADRALAGHLERVLGSASSPAQEHALLDRVLGDEGSERERLLHVVTVRHSWFFRDASQLAEIARFMVVRHAATRQPLSVWVAGCASGEEAWTLALLAHERGVPLHLLASDVDPLAVEEATRGEYDEFRLRELPPHFRTHFTALPEGRFRVRPDTLPDCRLEFRQHNLCGPLPEATFDLVSCRNVLIYLVPDQARTIATRLRTRLAPGGVLELGGIDRLSEIALGFGTTSTPPRPPEATPRARERASEAGGSTQPPPISAPQPPPTELLLAARDAILRDDPESAIALLEPPAARHAGHAELLLWLGLARHRAGRQREAIDTLRRARLLQPSLWPASLFAALAHERSDDDAAASRCWQELRRELDDLALAEPTGSAALLESLPEWRSEARALARHRTTQRRKTRP